MLLSFRIKDDFPWRHLALFALDGLLITAAFWLTYLLRLSNPWPDQLQQQIRLVLLLLPAGLGALIATGWYKGLTRYASSQSLYGLIPRTVFFLVLVACLRPFFDLPTPPRSFWGFFLFLFSSLGIGSRVLLRDGLRLWLSWKQPGSSRWPHGSKKRRTATYETKRSVVYGAGEAGSRLIEALRFDRRWHLAGVIDDDPSLWKWGRQLQGLKIHSPEKLPDLVRRLSIQAVLLAIPTANRMRRKELIQNLRELGLEVLTMPSLPEIASGHVRVADIRHIKIEDLLGRESSKANPHLLKASAQNCCVLISGAGGSIGSEIARQVARLGPSKLILLDNSEYALYAIERELKQNDYSNNLATNVPVRAVLGDVTRQAEMERLLKSEGVEVVFHAAAYKHVPLVESNLSAGLRNNILGTKSLLEASITSRVKRFTLISTDKAVRPTNAMGASKRVCELLVQDAASRQMRTICNMVRFGNVLGSSGSVVPLFSEQIAAGGPVTVTHPEVIRYFMTISEAAQLVLQASALSKGGEVFLLDMGEPVAINELARQMIELSGYKVLDADNPNGDIAITYTGLRPGEKLYEELLINDDDTPTEHPLIRQARESPPKSSELQLAVRDLLEAAEQDDADLALAKLQFLVPDYRTRTSTQ